MTVELQRVTASNQPGTNAALTEAFLVRLSVAFADPVRLKIITELFCQEMSPSQFQSTFGGGSLEAVCRQFKKLEQYGWLRLVREEPLGGSGRAGHIYRAPELAVFDGATWELLPQTLKEEFSWRIFEQFAERVKWAFEAETIDARKDRHFTWTPLVLDEKGRALVLSATNALVYRLFEEQRDAKLRLERSGESPIHATVGLSGFDSPAGRRNRSGLILPPPVPIEDERDRSQFFIRMSKVFRHPLNLKIITELNLRELSPSQFFREYREQHDLDVRDIHRRFRALTDDGWLQVVREDSGGMRRGAKERFYRATGPAIFDTQSWAQVPERVRERFSWRIFEQMAEQVREAMASGTFDSRTDRVHVWMALLLDERGWRQLTAATEALFDLIQEEERRAAVRLSQAGAEEPQIATVCLAVFESPAAPPSRAAETYEPWVY
jgi:Arc/MetJ-type ribon-helix-helix transcriptional regulator